MSTDGATTEETEDTVTETVEELGTLPKRVIKTTEKGLAYQKSIKFKEREVAIRMLDKASEQLRNLIDGNPNVSDVRKVYTTWSTLYENCLDTHDIYINLLNKDELTNDMFYEKDVDYKLLKRNSEKFILTHERAPSIAASRRSVLSKTSSIASQISLAKLKENQRKAELLAMAKSLEGKERLEQEKLTLKFKEEQFQIKTEMDLTAARLEVIENIEKGIESKRNETHDVNEINEAMVNLNLTGSPYANAVATSNVKMVATNVNETDNVLNVAATNVSAHNVSMPPITNINAETTNVNVTAPNVNMAATNVSTAASVNAAAPTSVSASNTSEFVKVLADSVNMNRLPIPEPIVFTGDPLQFFEWKTSFKLLIESKNITKNDKIFYLKKYVGGEAKQAISGCFY